MDATVRFGVEQKNGRTSFFDGGLFELILWSIIGIIVTILSFGLLYPWVLCRLMAWKIDHTVIDGKRMVFSGSAFSLYGNWLKWWVLTIITLGIYGFWVNIKLEDWKARNTHFVN